MPCRLMLKSQQLFNNLNLSLKPTYVVNPTSLVMFNLSVINVITIKRM